MTREEAIEIIRNEYLCVDKDCDIERSCRKCPYAMPAKEPILEAYNMAIKALEQEPTKEERALLQKWRDNRGISIEDFEDAMNALQEPKTDVLDKIRAEIEQMNNIDYVEPVTVEEVLQIIDKYREQEPKTGHWIRQDNTKEPLYGWYFCSECNSVIGDKTKFCSNCGCRMVEPQESEGKE